MKTEEKLNMTMLCDFYELTMGNGYFESGYKDHITYFDVFFRRVPDGGGFAIAAGLEQLIQAVGQQLAVGRAPKAGQRGEGGRSVQPHSDELDPCLSAFHPMHPQAGGDEQNVLEIQVQDLSLLQIELKAPSLAKQQADRATEGIRQPGIPLAAGQLADL